MAFIDVSEIVTDPDFQDALSLVRRSATVNAYGENVLTETTTSIYAVVQPATPDDLLRLPDSVRRRDAVTVYYQGVLSADAVDAYPDVIVWNGKRYQVQTADPYNNWGLGYAKAICTLIAPDGES